VRRLLLRIVRIELPFELCSLAVVVVMKTRNLCRSDAIDFIKQRGYFLSLIT
jgi:hypothetical protein